MFYLQRIACYALAASILGAAALIALGAGAGIASLSHTDGMTRAIVGAGILGASWLAMLSMVARGRR